MAKSLRSKWKRKCRAIKRVRYGEKEKARLAAMIQATEEKEKALRLEHEPQVLGGDGAEKSDEVVDMETGVKQEKRSSKTLLNEHGNYPVWMSRRKISKLKSKAGNKTAKYTDGKVTKRKNKKPKVKF